MPRIVGVDIPNEKRTVIALTYIHGVGDHTALRSGSPGEEQRTADGEALDHSRWRIVST